MATRSRTLSRFALVGAWLVAVLAVLLATSCNRGDSGPAASITIGVPPLEQNALLYVAEAEGLFARNGVKVTVKDYDTGVATLNAISKGEVDIAESAEFPFINAVLAGSPVSALAVNDRMMNDYIIGRKDRGIREIADLKGKKIGLARGTVVEFYLARFLTLHGLGLQDVTLVNMAPTQFVDAIERGDVDALAAWQPYVYQAMQKNVGGLVDWSVQNEQPVYGLLVARNDWVAQHQATVERFLKSLADAESFIARNPEKAKTIAQRRLDYDSAYIDSIWPQHHFSLSLDFSLVLALNDEAHWVIGNDPGTGKQAPDFLKFIHEDELKAVKPEAVNIIR